MTSAFHQPQLFDDHAGPSSGPGTSHEAGAAPGKASQRMRVLRCLLVYGDMRDEMIAQLLDIDKGSASKRRGELRDLGLVEHARDRATGQPLFAKTSRGSRAIVWGITPAGRKEAMA